MVTKKEIQYEGYGRCLEIANDLVRLVVTLDFGPRIIRYSFLDGENILFEDKDRVFSEANPNMDNVFGEGSVWYIYGGHRLWTSPEDNPRTYYPDNDPVSYELTDNGAVFMPPVQKYTQYGYTIRVSLHENTTEVTVDHGVTNHGPWDITLSPWPITVLSPGGTEIVPQPVWQTGCAPKLKMAFWDYVKMTDKRLVWLNEYITLKQDPQGDDRMKFGINSQHGYAMYFNHGDMFLKQFSPKQDGNYPDGGMSFETFTNPLFLEMETLGELTTITPGNTTWHTETWSLHKADLPELTDEAIGAFKKQYIK
ncbi:MAG: hypothetical protein IJF61_05040 [Clostridia bacterium]|nr:hypothetical protein [Clostridia bacterium]